MSKLNGLYIPSIDAKDLYLAMNMVKDEGKRKRQISGYTLTTQKGALNFKKFINVFDASLDLDKIKEVAEDKLPPRDPLWFTSDLFVDKEFSNKIINVTFKYSCKAFNKIKKDTFVKFGYDFRDLTFTDNVAFDDGEIVGIIANQPTVSIVDQELPKGFSHFIDTDGEYKYKSGNIPVLKTISQLREELYKNGFNCEKRSFVRCKRSSGSARVGKCLFIDARLYDDLHKWEMCGLEIAEGEEVDLAALESYIALPTSSIIGYLDIDPKSILVIPDADSTFDEESIVTELDKDNNLVTTEKTVTVRNSIFDGQSLIDKSLMKEYDQFGMVLLRNRFFKSCCFNTNIQQWFSDNNITSIDQLHKDSITMAKSIDEIKLITTPNSIKYVKFGAIKDWIMQIDSKFGVVKHEKKTHFFDGKLVQSHYQLLNTVKMDRGIVKDFLAPSIDYLKKLNTDVDVFKFHTKSETPIIPDDKTELRSATDFVYFLLAQCPKFAETQMFYDFRKNTSEAYLINMKKGHILIDGNYSTLFGNPVEMLNQAIGKFNGNTTLSPNTIHTTRYSYDKNILGCRSPHISTSNLLVAKNVRADDIDRYFNLTDEIVCINSINENILERLSGADFDSDQIIISDNKYLINAALQYYDIFKVPANHVEAQKVKRTYTSESKADLDFKTSGNKIGEIVNLSQELNSKMWQMVWDLINEKGEANLTNKDVYSHIKTIYYDICQLNVMSCIEIDKAKKEFAVNMASELKKIKKRHIEKDHKKREIKPKFLGFISKQKGFYNSSKKSYRWFDTTMDYVLKELNIKFGNYASMGAKFSSCFEFDEYDTTKVNYRQISYLLDRCYQTRNIILSIYNSETYFGYESYEKAFMVAQEENILNMEFRDVKINIHTLYKLITCIDDNDYSEIRRFLFRLIFTNFIEEISELLIKQKSPRTRLIPNRYGDTTLYEMNYSREELFD